MIHCVILISTIKIFIHGRLIGEIFYSGELEITADKNKYTIHNQDFWITCNVYAYGTEERT